MVSGEVTGVVPTDNVLGVVGQVSGNILQQTGVFGNGRVVHITLKSPSV